MFFPSLFLLCMNKLPVSEIAQSCHSLCVVFARLLLVYCTQLVFNLHSGNSHKTCDSLCKSNDNTLITSNNNTMHLVTTKTSSFHLNAYRILIAVLILSNFCIVLAEDYYKILGIPKDASPQQIKQAYKKLALKWYNLWLYDYCCCNCCCCGCVVGCCCCSSSSLTMNHRHPDKASPEDKELYSQKYIEIANAYEVLRWVE